MRERGVEREWSLLISYTCIIYRTDCQKFLSLNTSLLLSTAFRSAKTCSIVNSKYKCMHNIDIRIRKLQQLGRSHPAPFLLAKCTKNVKNVHASFFPFRYTYVLIDYAFIDWHKRLVSSQKNSCDYLLHFAFVHFDVLFIHDWIDRIIYSVNHKPEG